MRWPTRMCGVTVVLLSTHLLVGKSDSDDLDPLRPGYHFLPQSNWMNDPNGPFQDDETGLYHLMYQYLTPRVWGHAVSSNLVDWDILPIALNYTDQWYTQVPNEVPGVYSGSATKIPAPITDSNPRSLQVWLSVSTPTNDMMLLAYPSNLTDPKLVEWSWDENNPVIYANGSFPNVPPGRDPTEFWSCGDDKWCVGYATQLSQGCPCSNISGFVIFSSSFKEDLAASSSPWGPWEPVGYMLNDTAGAVMWECPDFFLLVNESSSTRSDSVWMFKYSIGPGPSFATPWGIPGPRDYYVTGLYNPSNPLDFRVDEALFSQAMARSLNVALDPGAFYASKTFLSDVHGRLLWGWLPEERPTDSHGDPFGWAGVMSLPREIVPYRVNNTGSQSWLVRTPPLKDALLELRGSSSPYIYTNLLVPTASAIPLEGTSGQQLELSVFMNISADYNNSDCGLRVLSSDSADIDVEFTDVGLEFVIDDAGRVTGVLLYVDTTMSCSDADAEVNRTKLYSAELHRSQFEDEGLVQLQVLVDHSVIEAFLEGGRRTSTRRVYPAKPTQSIEVMAYSKCHTPGTCAPCLLHNVSSWALRNANITTGTDSTIYDSSVNNGGDSGDELRGWEIALAVVLPIVAIAAGVAMYVHCRPAKKDADDVRLL